MEAILNLIYCFLTDMIAKFVDVWVGMWDSLLTPIDTMLSYGGNRWPFDHSHTNGIRLALGCHRHEPMPCHHRGGHGHTVRSANGPFCDGAPR